MRSGWLQLTHAPVQPTLQQTPSAQKPDSQSLGSLHADPAARLGAQAVPAQLSPQLQVPVVQSASQAQS
jgi:hypothetical protein